MATHELEASVRDRDGVAIIDLAGDIGSSAEAALEVAYREAAHGRTAVVLNFASTDYINSTGIALIVGLLAQARARGITLTACGLSDHYREIFEITRLSDFMRLSDSEDSAIGANHA
jgi:anti-anti-sigma factor